MVHVGLELKHVQLDSLGHVMSRHMSTCGHFNEAAKHFRNTLRFFTGNYKDTEAYVIKAYQCGSFDKIREFIKLRDRLAASQHYACVNVERMLLDLLTETLLLGQTVLVRMVGLLLKGGARSIYSLCVELRTMHISLLFF